MKPRISVIIPVYNVEKYIKRCIESVFTQTYRDYEVILVDDGSPDSSGKLCDEYTSYDHRVKVIHKQNGGLSSARNAGLDVASGEYVTFIDSDDVIHPQYLEHLFSLCEENDADISMGRLKRFSEKTSPRIELFDSSMPSVKVGRDTLYCFFDEKIGISNYVSACCKLYRRSLFEGIRFPEGRLFEDEFITYQLFYKANKVAISENILYFYFVNDAGITGNLNLMKRCDEYDAQWERLCFFEDNQLTELWKLAVKRYLATAQWDLIESFKMKSNDRIQEFQKQYRMVLERGKKVGCIDFLNNYDYFVIAYPKRVMIYRILRQIGLRRDKWKRRKS